MIIENSKLKVLLHTCCAPCLTAVDEKLSDQFEPVIFWFNPNIEPKQEYEKRLGVLKEFTKKIGVELIESMTKYEIDNAEWSAFVGGFANEPEGGKRCEKCIEFRLRKTAEKAKGLGLKFTTTLSVSPHKNAESINKAGHDLSEQLGLEYLAANFKKENGHLRSIELSKKFNLYRQNYCGCRYSKNKTE